ncbi:MAG: glycosyltransferase [Verrucomicrobiales bacterium]|jgi:hopene-associated glycosyltransferase HpnB|nr:glycosyltransferase [Verrucomicrobiales bacterium]
MVLTALILLVLVLIAWDFILIEKIRRWDFQPIGDLEENKPSPDQEKLRIAVVVPARNESGTLPTTLPALYHQDFPGQLTIHLMDDNSTDRTTEAARAAVEFFEHQNRSLVIHQGEPLPAGWAGKVWAMHQGLRHIRAAAANGRPLPDYVLLTDADILHQIGSVSRLAAESKASSLALNSRMALLRCESFWEKLLIPAFVFFFNLLYPMRRINNPKDKFAGAAGGCVLLSREALDKLGWGLESIKGCIIDDVNLARQVKSQGLPIRLALSYHEVISERPYDTLGEIWRMVRRSAYTELKHNPLRLLVAAVGLFATFVLPTLAVINLLVELFCVPPLTTPGYAAGVCGFLILMVQFFVYRPAIKFFGLNFFWNLSLPLAGLLYGLMTIDSARMHYFSHQNVWRGKR